MDLATKVARIIETAKKNLCEGVILEPRFFFDEITVPQDSGIMGASTPGVFKNGQDWPIHITKMVAAIRLLDDDGNTVTDERILQRVGLRLSFHGSDYMSRDFNVLPLWQSRPVAAAQIVTQGVSSHVFDVPWILSARDSLKVGVALDSTPTQPRTISVAFTGYGIQTQRPYFKAGSVALDDTVKHIIPTDSFRNDGDEPICVTDMTVHVSAESGSNSPAGDTRYGRIQVSQIGNGTQANWFAGPIGGADLMPASLIGTRSGRAVVHEFPRPLIWEPGEGIHAEVQATEDDLGTAAIVLALAVSGTIVMSGSGDGR